MSDQEDSPTPPLPEEPVPGGEGAAGETARAAPVAKAFVCSKCRKGKLDATGLRMGDWMACPECGHRTKVTLEHTMGEERASRRQKVKKTFEEMDEEERAAYLASKTPVERFFLFVRHKLGPKGVVSVYLGLVVLVGAGVIAYKVIVEGMTINWPPWWVWPLTLLGAALLGVGAHFGYVSLMYYYRKNIAPKTAGSETSSSRRIASRRRSSTRRRPPAEDG
jgi:hypothetical protein